MLFLEIEATLEPVVKPKEIGTTGCALQTSSSGQVGQV